MPRLALNLVRTGAKCVVGVTLCILVVYAFFALTEGLWWTLAESPVRGVLRALVWPDEEHLAARAFASQPLSRPAGVFTFQATHFETERSFHHVDPLRLLQWNVLAPSLVVQYSSGYKYVPASTLANATRTRSVISLIEETQASIITLQEVEQFDSVWRQSLDALGYDGVWAPKRNNVRHGNGPAVFWQRRKLSKIADLVVPLSANASQVALLSVLHSNAQNVGLLVASVHLKSCRGEACQGKRALQVELLTRKLAEVASEYNIQAIVVAGDMNGGPSEPLHTKFDAEKFRSAYYYAGGRDPPFTFAMFHERSTLDYIYILPARVRVVRTMILPEDERILLPNDWCPSDHLPLGIDFVLT